MVSDVKELWQLLEAVKDPEIPVLSAIDLGVIRDVALNHGSVEVIITPTYSGCPAMNTIEADIRKVIRDAGFEEVEVITQLDPAWTTDWLTDRGKERLEEYGIAPPQEKSSDKNHLMGILPTVKCPQCKSINTVLVSQFGSTACKAHYKCNDCLEPFDYFKCL